MRALDVQDDPAVGTVHDDEIQRDGAAAIVEGDGDIGLVELPEQARYRDGAKLPGRALDQEIVGLILHRNPCRPQTWIEEPACGGGIARQPVREFGRPVAVIGVDVAHQRFRRTETSLDGRETGQQNQDSCENPRDCRLAWPARFLCGCPCRTLAAKINIDGHKLKTECVNCSMKCLESLRSIRRRRYGAPHAGRAASVFTPMRVSSTRRMVWPLPSMTSRSARLPGARWLRRPGRSLTPS